MKNLRIYIAVVILYWLLLAVFLLLYGYKESFIILNNLNTPAVDYILYFLTWFGDSLFICSLVVMLFPRKTAMLLMLIFTVAVSGLLVQVLKHWVFSGWDRPLKVFEDIRVVHIVGNYRLFHGSFPSGHSVTTGAAFTLLAWYLRDKRMWVIFLACLAVIVSYTRIYTGSHFAGDVLAGSIMGTLISIGFIYFFDRRMQAWVSRWADKTAFRFRFVIQIIAAVGLIVSIIKYFDYLIN